MTHSFDNQFPQLTITDSLRAITIHAPWAWAIAEGYKLVENRSWIPKIRGLLAIHAGRSQDSDQGALQTFSRIGITPPPQFERGAIIGTVELADVLPLDEYLRQYGKTSQVDFAIGPFCWVLRNPQRCKPIKCPGNFQTWSVKNQLRHRGE